MNDFSGRGGEMRILIVGEDRAGAASLATALEREGHRYVRTAADVIGAEELRRKSAFDLILFESGSAAAEVVKSVARLSAAAAAEDYVPLLVLTPAPSPETRLEILKAGAIDVVAKPYAQSEVLRRAQNLLRVKSLYDRQRAEKKALERKVEELSGRLRDSEARARRRRDHDALTKLPNRVQFRRRLLEAASGAAAAGERLGLLFIDLDRFGRLNDTLGHVIGDQMLKEAGMRICARVGDDGTVGRLGDDEFGVILPALKRSTDAELVARKILSGLSEAFQSAGGEVVLSGSIGIGIFPDAGEDAGSLMGAAEEAAIRAKLSGGNAYKFAGVRKGLPPRNAQLDHDLVLALARNEFALHYQPIFDAKSGRITGAEALIRWYRRSGRVAGPGEFIGIAEDSGLIVPIGEWVFRTACRQAAAWAASSLPPLDIAVNVSPRQCRDTGFAQMVEDVIREVGVNPTRISLEITESFLMDPANAHAAAAFCEMRNMGIHVALDDFGSGYCSLNYVRRFPSDILKIDRSLVENVTSDPVSKALIRAIYGMAKALGNAVVAEGIETKEQARNMRAGLCDRMQGYHFSKPLSSEAFESFVRSSAGAKGGRFSRLLQPSPARAPH